MDHEEFANHATHILSKAKQFLCEDGVLQPGIFFAVGEDKTIHVMAFPDSEKGRFYLNAFLKEQVREKDIHAIFIVNDTFYRQPNDTIKKEAILVAGVAPGKGITLMLPYSKVKAKYASSKKYIFTFENEVRTDERPMSRFLDGVFEIAN